MDKQLRIIAGVIVTESKLSKNAKLQLLAFIQHEATDIQIKALLLDGKILTTVDEQTEQVVNDRFKVSEAGGRVAKLRKSYMSLGGSGSGMGIMWLAYRKIRSMFDNCTRRCGNYEINTSRRQHCMIKCKVEKYKAQLAEATKAKNNKEISKAKANLNKAEAQLKKSMASFQARGAETG